MSFNQENFSPISAHATNSPRIFSYKTDDSLTDVLTDNYFYDKRFQLEAGDVVLVAIDADVTLINISEASASTVTTVEYQANAYDYATIDITQDEDNPITVVGTGSDQLVPPSTPQDPDTGNFSGYEKVTSWVLERSEGVTFADGELTILTKGIYKASIGWGNFRHTQNNATVGFVFGIERGGLISFSQRPTSSKVPNLGDIGNISGGGTFEAEAGDKLSVWLASNISGDVKVINANVSIFIHKKT